MGSDNDIIKEINIKSFPQPVTINGTEIILNQMKKSICKIYLKGGGKGSGFFCNISYGNDKIKTLITNYHVIDQNYIEKYKEIQFSFNNKKIENNLIIDNNRKTYFSEEYDTTIIEIKNEDQIINNQYLELDNDIFKEKGYLHFEKQSIYNISYPNENEVSVSYGLINNIDHDKIQHLCSTESGSSGSPIFNLANNKVIGIHYAGHFKFTFNYAYFLKHPIKEFIKKYSKEIIHKKSKSEHYNKDNNISNNSKNFDDSYLSKTNSTFNSISNISNNNSTYSAYMNSNGFYKYNSNGCINEIKKPKSNKHIKIKENKIKIKLIVGKKDLNKKIYFLNESYLKGILNNSFVELYINNQNEKFEKYYITPKIEQKYSIILKFKKDIKDCSNMFMDCKNILTIDLSSFNTKNVKNMSGMFRGCQNLVSIDLTSFNTKKVDNMSYMFCNCINLNELNLSSFETENVINMHEMFYNCSNLSNIKISSSFDTRIVSDMKYIFSGCNRLGNLTYDGGSNNNQKLLEEFYIK